MPFTLGRKKKPRDIDAELDEIENLLKQIQKSETFAPVGNERSSVETPTTAGVSFSSSATISDTSTCSSKSNLQSRDSGNTLLSSFESSGTYGTNVTRGTHFSYDLQDSYSTTATGITHGDDAIEPRIDACCMKFYGLDF
mmetsp:Transcript_9924/g.12500  ORF Transcript_9924/g.12500 Transcript_9924/m.12500 type:complete len:140 (+) Transcript_9924:214-633(+)